MAAMLPITGTVSVGFDGRETQAVGTFSIPVRMTMDTETGLAHVEGATDSSIIFAMVAALQGAADELLATIQPATVEIAAPESMSDADAYRALLEASRRQSGRMYRSYAEDIAERCWSATGGSETIPTVKAETIAVCPTCSAELGVADASITIEHGHDGAHIENHRY
ncbi:hypothetical protein [Cryobacterium sp. Y57]|uniref:hypothetical protein n=1 Tax=Cryobacterium sp. Y57 TaxID=2048287 RepID=UPI000CE56446|nr:hypothetical protein [Cryobacterium sp. Y57]